MNNLLILVLGNTPEEIRRNGKALIAEALSDREGMGDKANCLGPEGEYEFIPDTCMANWLDRVRPKYEEE